MRRESLSPGKFAISARHARRQIAVHKPSPACTSIVASLGREFGQATYGVIRASRRWGFSFSGAYRSTAALIRAGPADRTAHAAKTESFRSNTRSQNARIGPSNRFNTSKRQSRLAEDVAKIIDIRQRARKYGRRRSTTSAAADSNWANSCETACEIYHSRTPCV